MGRCPAGSSVLMRTVADPGAAFHKFCSRTILVHSYSCYLLVVQEHASCTISRQLIAFRCIPHTGTVGIIARLWCWVSMHRRYVVCICALLFYYMHMLLPFVVGVLFRWSILCVHQEIRLAASGPCWLSRGPVGSHRVPCKGERNGSRTSGISQCRVCVCVYPCGCGFYTQTHGFQY